MIFTYDNITRYNHQPTSIIIFHFLPLNHSSFCSLTQSLNHSSSSLSLTYQLIHSLSHSLTHTYALTGGQWSSVDNFKRHFPGLKSSVIGSINELYNEIDNTTVICQRAQDYIHADECILTYGYSRIIEQFFKAAGIKRKFQLIIAESSPSMDGHKLAHALSKVCKLCYRLSFNPYRLERFFFPPVSLREFFFFAFLSILGSFHLNHTYS